MKVSSVLDPRAEELLAERALRPLDDHELRELERLGVAGDDSFDIAAAAIALATTPIEAMPSRVAERILAAAPQPSFTRTLPGVAYELPRDTLVGVDLAAFDPAPREGPPLPQHSVPLEVQPAMPSALPPPPMVDLGAERARRMPAPRRVILPWLAAAACLLVAGGAIWYAQRDRGTPGVAHSRAELLASAADATTIAWKTTDEPNAKGASGDVVWSAAQQRGYMRFTGLAANNPSQFQYQLWIFDKTRDDKFPVDGGVFDVSSTGEVTVEISPKLHVSDATLFAVTIEKPGGVVVSKREHIVVTAARG